MSDELLGSESIIKRIMEQHSKTLEYLHMSEKQDELVEKVARAMCASDFDGDTNVYDLKNNNFRSDYLFRARAAIAVVLEEAAKVADGKLDCDPMDDFDTGWSAACADIAAAIRGMIKEDQ